MNLTLEYHGVLYKPTEECFAWCKSAVDDYASNAEIHGIFLIILAMGLLLIRDLYLWRHDKIEKELTSIFDDYVDLLPMLSGYLLIGFLVWYKWFQ